MNGKGQRILLTLMLTAAAALLLGQALWMPGAETAIAEPYVSETLRLTGRVTCEETILPAKAGSWYALLADGQRTAAGQRLYVFEKPDETAKRQARILESAAAGSRQPAVLRDAALQRAVMTLSRAKNASRVEAAENLTAAVLAMEKPETAALPEENTSCRCVAAPVSGVFVSDPTGKTMGRIVTGDTWYLTLDPVLTGEVGQTLEVELLSGIFRQVELTVEEKTADRMLLSCDEALGEAACLATITVKIQKEMPSGLEIPSRAVYTEEGETGVWCLVGDSVRWKPITVLYETEDTVIVALDAGNTANLLPGDIVLLEDRRK